MKNGFFIVSAMIALLWVSNVSAHSLQTRVVCPGFVPENDLYIPDDDSAENLISEHQFNRIIERISALYASDIAKRGGELEVEQSWKDGTVNAFAYQEGTRWVIRFSGGLARHRRVTQDGFAAVVCHELGHHLGGAPKLKQANRSWASNEGAADYFATLKCLRRYFQYDDNDAVLSRMKVDPTAVAGCEAQHKDRRDQSLCIRATMAGLSTAGLFQEIGKEGAISLRTPDKRQVSRTYDSHPRAQCRLDTYYQGALCTEPVYRELSDADYRPGSCYDAKYHRRGLRPSCWFKPY